MNVLTAFLVFSFLSGPVLACGNHPGTSHEEWSSSMREDKNAKTGKMNVFSGDFFRAPAGDTSDGTRGNGRGGRGERRPGRAVR